MTIPPINLNKLVQLLKSEGRMEMMAATPQPKLLEITARTVKPPKLFEEWDKIMLILEREILPLLSKGCDSKSLIAPAHKLAKSASAIALLASEVLSFVPGPIGIVCSLINAIVQFSYGNIPLGFLELLGCIPGGKTARKVSSKLYPKINNILIEAIQSNHQLKIIVESCSTQQKVVIEFFEKYGPKTGTHAKPRVGYDYGPRTPPPTPSPSVLEQSLIKARRDINKYTIYKNTYGNMPKSNLWPKLGY